MTNKEADRPETTKDEKQPTWKTVALKLAKVAFKLGFLWPVTYVVSEGAQILAMVAMVGLAVPLPAPWWKTGLAVYGAFTGVRYALTTVIRALKGIQDTPTAKSKQTVSDAASEMLKTIAKPPGGGNSGLPSGLNPDTIARLRSASATLARQRAAMGKQTTASADDDAPTGQYL